MNLFHERAFPRAAGLCSSDVEECFSEEGRRKGIWLTTERLVGPGVLSFETSEEVVLEYEITRPDEQTRTFVVPFGVARELTSIATGA
jgi:hypothetical protein